jgi:FkbM family methyltransferase
MENNVLKVSTAIRAFAVYPEGDLINYECARAYESEGQTSAAIGFYLRAAERTNDKNLAYECLCRVGLCFEKQTKRDNTVRVFYNHALHLLPKRPEAYFLLARHYERKNDHIFGYMYADMGLNNSDVNQAPLRNGVEYPGWYGLLFQKMVSAWWWGKQEECRDLMVKIKNEYRNELDDLHRESLQRNLNVLGITPESHVLRPYKIWQSSMLRYKFPGYDKIYRNYSQVYQDLFVLSMLNGKKNGTYLEIGTAGPEYGNNTKLLEELGWKGVGIEWDTRLAAEYAAGRKNPVLNEDATKVDYVKLLLEVSTNREYIHYLQLDCEPASTTYEILTKIPFNLFKFAVITYEHDDYVDMTGLYRQKSREFLSSRGYVLVVSDISPDGVSNFEDWWVHPDLVDNIGVMKDVGEYTKHATKYMLCEPFKEIPESAELDKVDYTGNSRQFSMELNREVVVEKIYERYFPVDKGSVVVDIGANIGLFPWTLKHRDMAMVYAVEPSKVLIPALRNNMDNLPFPVKVLPYGIGYKTGEHNIDNNDWLAGEKLDLSGSFMMKTFQDFLVENNIDHINFLKIDCEGGEYAVFNEDNYEFLTTKVDKIVGEWHLSYAENGLEKFIQFKNTYLKGKTNFRVFEPFDWKEVTHKVCDDAWIHEFYNWWNPRSKGAQLIIYIDNTSEKS